MENILTQPQYIKTTFLLRRGLISEWEEKNPVLAYGEPGVGYEIEEVEDETIEPTILSYVLKIGDGKKPWKDLGPVASDKEVQLKYENFEYEINNLVNQYIVLGPPQENGERLPAAGMIYSLYGSSDDAGDINEYGTDDNIIVDGKSSFAVGRNIKILRDTENNSKPNYSAAFGAHHNMYGYGSVAFGNSTTVYSNSQYSFTAGRQVSNYGSKAIIAGESTNKFDNIINKRTDVNSMKDITSEQMLTIFKEAGNGKETALAYGDYSTNFGQDNITYGKNSVALGVQNFTGEISSIALGHSNEVLGKYAVGLGTGHKINGEGAVATGYHNIIDKNDYDPVGAFAIGMDNLVTGGYAFSGGVKSQATQYGSFAFGYGIKADNQNAMFVGRLNDNTDGSIIFGVGNGTGEVSNISLSEDAKSFEDGEGILRQNAFTVHLDGHAEVQTQGKTKNSIAQVDYVNTKTEKTLTESKEYSDKLAKQYVSTTTYTEDLKTLVKTSEFEQYIEDMLEDVYLETDFSTEENHIDLLDLSKIPTTIKATTFNDLDNTNIIINNGKIDENTLSTVAYTNFVDKFEVVDDPTGSGEKCLYADILNTDAYYWGWTTGETTQDKIHIETGKDYVLAFDLIGKIAVYRLENAVTTSGWVYFNNQTNEWETQVLHFRTADTISNSNYIISFGCPSVSQYENTYIRNIRVLEDPCLQVISNDQETVGNVLQEIAYNPAIKGFDEFVAEATSVQLKLINKTEGNEYVGNGLKGTYYKPANSAIQSIQTDIANIQNNIETTKTQIIDIADWKVVKQGNNIIQATIQVRFTSLDVTRISSGFIFRIFAPNELVSLNKITATYNEGTYDNAFISWCSKSTNEIRIIVYDPDHDSRPDDAPSAGKITIVLYS